MGQRFWLVAIAAVAAFALGGTAFTQAMTPASTNAAQQANTIGGFTTSGLTYTLSTTDPRNVAQVSFTIVNPGLNPSFVRVQPYTGASWYTCTTAPSGSDYIATCATTSPQWTLVSANAYSTTTTIVIKE